MEMVGKPTVRRHLAVCSSRERNSLSSLDAHSPCFPLPLLLSSSCLTCTRTSNPLKGLTNSLSPLASTSDDLSNLRRQGFSGFGGKAKVSSNPIQLPERHDRARSSTSLASWRRFGFVSKKVKSIVLLNVITVVYASSIPAVKDVEAITEPSIFSAVRFAVSAIPFMPFVFQSIGDVRVRNAGLELGFWVGLGYLTQAIGLLTSDAGRASFISSLTIIVVPLLDGMLGATLPFYTWLGAFMSVVGVALLESSGSPPCVGDFLNLLSAVFFGVHMLRTEHISRSTKRDNFLAILGYELGVVALLSTTWFVLVRCFGATEGHIRPSWTWMMIWDWMLAFPWAHALYTGLFSTGLCLWLEMGAMRDVSATETAIIYGMEPVWGAVFAWFLLGERWGDAGWAGAVFVIAGSLMVQMLGSSPPSKSRE